MLLFAKIWAIWCRLDRKIRFLLVGGFNTVVSYLVFLFLLWLAGSAHYQFALLMSWLLTTLSSFLTQKYFVWQTHGHFWAEYFKCLFTWMFSYLINAALLELLVKYILFPVWLAQALAIAAITVFTYLIFKYFAFARKKS